jgi:peptide/nickel transport system permease protein
MTASDSEFAAESLVTRTGAPVVARPARVWHKLRRNRVALVASVYILIVALTAVFAPLLHDLDAFSTDLGAITAGPSWAHPLGTDQSGRDILARTILGTRTSLVVGFASVAIYVTIGAVLGIMAGFFGGILDILVGRLVDALLSIPLLLLVTVFIAFLTPSVLTVILVIGLLGWPPTVRIARAQTMSIRESDFIAAVRLAGIPTHRILRVHVLPNLVAPLIVIASLGVGTAILLEAALGFLGLGVRPPAPSLGEMITAAKDPVVLRNHPFVWVPPAVVVALLVMAVNIIGDALRDALSNDDAGRSGE